MAVELRPHQAEAVKKMHNGCILYGGVGVGKSITALAYFFEEVCGGEVGTYGFTQGARDLYIITTAKKRDNLDWEHEALHFGITKHDDDNVNGINLVVDSWNNIDKYKDVKDAFFIFDEQRLVGSGAWTKAFIKIAKSNEWVLLTATPGDTWLDYIPVFVANGFYKNRTEFKLRHVVYNTYSKFPKVDRYLETGHLLRLRNSLLVHMPYERHTTRHEQSVWVDYDQDLMKKVEEERWHVYENRPLRDVAEQLSVMRKVVNSDSSRLLAVRDLLKNHPKLIVFYNFDYELEILRTLALPETEQKPLTNSSTLPNTNASNGTSLDGKSKSKKAHASSKKQDGLPDTSTTLSDGSLVHPLALEWHQMFQELEMEQQKMLQRQGRNSNPSSENTSTNTGNGSRNGSLVNHALAVDNSATVKRNGTSTRSQCLETTTTGSMNSTDTETSTDLSVAIAEWNGDMWVPERTLGDESTKVIGHPKLSDLNNSDEKGPSLVEANGPSKSPLNKFSTQATSATTSGTGSGKTESKSGAPVVIAEWNGHKHEPIPTTDSWVYLVQYQAGAEGWNCTETDAMCFYSLTYSYKLFHQAHGRIDRLNTPFRDLWYVTLMSRSSIDVAVRKSLRTKQNFNESSMGVKW